MSKYTVDYINERISKKNNGAASDGYTVDYIQSRLDAAAGAPVRDTAAPVTLESLIQKTPTESPVTLASLIQTKSSMHPASGSAAVRADTQKRRKQQQMQSRIDNPTQSPQKPNNPIKMFADYTAQGAKDSMRNVGNAVNAEVAKQYDVNQTLDNPLLKLFGVDKAIKKHFTPEGLETVEQVKNSRNAAIVAVQNKIRSDAASKDEKYQNANPIAKEFARIGGGGVGSMLPAIGASLISPATGSQMLYAQAAGGDYAQAKEEGATDAQAYKNAELGGLLSVSIEKVFGGIPMLGKGAVPVSDMVSKYVSNPVGKAVVNRIAEATGEGIEEVAENLIKPYIQQYTYGKQVNHSEVRSGLGEAFAGGALASLLLGVPGDVKNGIDAKRKNSIPPTQVNAEASQSAVSDTAFSNPSISKLSDNATPSGSLLNALYQDYSPNALVRAYQNGTLSNAQIETLKPGGVNRAAFESAAGVKLPDTSSDTRVFLRVNTASNRLEENTVRTPSENKPKSESKLEFVRNGISVPSIANSAQNATPTSKEASDNILNQLYNQSGDLGAKTSQFKYKEADSKFRTNTMENTDMLDAADRAVMPSEEFKHQVITEKQSLSEAAQRAAIDFDGEVSDLMKKSEFDGTDFDTGMKILEKYKQDFSSAEVGSVEREIAGNKMLDWAKTMQQKSTDIGQALQAHAKYTRTPEGTVLKAQSAVANAQKQWSKENPNLAKAMDELTRKLETIADNYANDLPADPMTALSELEKAVKKVVGDSEVKLKQSDIEKLITAMSRDSGKDIGDFLKELDNIPVINGDDVMRIMDIMSEAEKYGVNSRKRVELENQAYKIVADKFNSSAMDKWNAWRYLAMLGNPRTHIRNFVGNTFFGSVTRIKDDMSAVLQSATDATSKALGKGGIAKTTSVLNPLSDSDKRLKTAAKENADEVYALLTQGGKYNPVNAIDNQRQVFKNKLLEIARNFNSDALEKEDWFALKGKYADSLSRYLKANGADKSIFSASDDAGKELLQQAQAYAVNEAQKATFRDANKLVDGIAQFQKNAKELGDIGNSGISRLAGKAANIGIEGILPFKKTPANIVARAFEYNPVGALVNIGFDIHGIKAGTKTVAQAIDALAAGLTGTGIMALGYYLFDNGFITSGRSDNKKEQNFDDLRGAQSYALNLGDKSYTLDWMAPAALPLFVGAEFCKQFKDTGELDFNGFMTALSKIPEPMVEMTMMQGLNSTLASAAYSTGSPLQAIGTAALTGYATQGMPTVLGQVARALDDTQRTTYTDKQGISGAVDKTVQRIQKKAPGLTQQLQPVVDQWGRVQKANGGDNILSRLAYNMLSPGYLSEDKTTPTDNILNQLYKSTGESRVLPSSVSKSYSGTKDGKNETVRLTPKQHTQMAQTRGQAAKSILDELTPMLGGVPDDAAVKIVQDAYRVATDAAKSDVLGFELPKTSAVIMDASDGSYESIANLLFAKQVMDNVNGDKYPNGKTISGSAQRKKMKALQDAGYSYPEAQYFYNLFK